MISWRSLKWYLGSVWMHVRQAAPGDPCAIMIISVVLVRAEALAPDDRPPGEGTHALQLSISMKSQHRRSMLTNEEAQQLTAQVLAITQHERTT